MSLPAPDSAADNPLEMPGRDPMATSTPLSTDTSFDHFFLQRSKTVTVESVNCGRGTSFRADSGLPAIPANNPVMGQRRAALAKSLREGGEEAKRPLRDNMLRTVTPVKRGTPMASSPASRIARKGTNSRVLDYTEGSV